MGGCVRWSRLLRGRCERIALVFVLPRGKSLVTVCLDFLLAHHGLHVMESDERTKPGIEACAHALLIYSSARYLRLRPGMKIAVSSTTPTATAVT